MQSYPRGVAEISVNGFWSPICGHFFWDNDEGATTFCKKLGYESGVRHHTRQTFEVDSFEIGECGAGEALNACTLDNNYRDFTNWCSAGNAIGVEIECSNPGADAPIQCPAVEPVDPNPRNCSDYNVRLTEYPRGLAEIWINNMWSPVCGHFFWDNDEGATTFCQNLGYERGIRHHARTVFEVDSFEIGECGAGEPLFACTLDNNYRDFTSWCSAGNGIGVEIECFGGSPTAGAGMECTDGT
jgi:hypothetical protein